MSQFDEKLHTNASCDYLVNFFEENKKITDIRLFTSLEIFDPEIMMQRALDTWRKQGYTEKEISKMLEDILKKSL